MIFKTPPDGAEVAFAHVQLMVILRWRGVQRRLDAFLIEDFKDRFMVCRRRRRLRRDDIAMVRQGGGTQSRLWRRRRGRSGSWRWRRRLGKTVCRGLGLSLLRV